MRQQLTSVHRRLPDFRFERTPIDEMRAKRLPVWRALTAVLYRAHGVGRKPRGKNAEAA